MFAVLRGVTILRPMIYGRPFEIRTDHASLVHHDPAKMTNPKLQRWATTLSQYGAKLVYVKGKNNTIADYMSRLALPEGRLPVKEAEGRSRLIRYMEVDLDKSDEEAGLDPNPEPKTVEAVDPGRAEGPDTDQELDIPSNSNPGLKLEDIHDAETIVQAQRADDHCRRIRIETANPSCPPSIRDRYLMLNRQLHCLHQDEQPRLVVPEVWRESILEEAHEVAHGGHFSIKRTYSTLKRFLYWLGQYKDVVEWIDQCVACNQANLMGKDPC